MANDKYSFLPPECSVCGESLTAPVAGMKGKIPMGYCPNCGTPHPLDVESPTEPTEPTEPATEGTGEGEGAGEGGEGSEESGEGTGEPGEGSEEPSE
ncbi:unnamed protein product [marine sediment metagenome]|uniref:Uncharacterized protein n=1 Tax=marine sediment metagenome TaxID=412755 RepID=X1ECH4_9ZZZZ